MDGLGEIHHGLVETDYNTIVEGVGARANHMHCAEKVVFVHMTHTGSGVLTAVD